MTNEELLRKYYAEHDEDALAQLYEQNMDLLWSIAEARRNFCEIPTFKLRKTPPHQHGAGAFPFLVSHDVLLMPGAATIRPIT